MLLADPGASDHLVANLCGMVRSGKARKNNDSAAKRREYFENSLPHLLVFLRTQVEDRHSITTLDKIVIAFPYLVGCGIAGASWQDYYALLHGFEKSGEHVFGSNCGFEVLLFDESAKHAGWAQRLGLAAPITPMPDDVLRKVPSISLPLPLQARRTRWPSRRGWERWSSPRHCSGSRSRPWPTLGEWPI